MTWRQGDFTIKLIPSICGIVNVVTLSCCLFVITMNVNSSLR